MAHTLYIEALNVESPLVLDEWIDLLKEDGEFVLEEGINTTNPSGEVIVVTLPVARWMEHPEDKEPVFCWLTRRVAVRQPDVFTIDKMKQLALRLHAQVVDEEGTVV